MKPKLVKAYALSILVIAAISSCLKDRNNDDRIIIDYFTFGYLSVWKETDNKIGTADWETIPNGHTLSIFSNIADSVRPRNGAYLYNSGNSNFNIDTSGYFEQKDSAIWFISMGSKDTASFEYKIYGDTSLILSNTLSTPTRQIRYKKNN